MLFFFSVQMLCINLFLDVFIYGFRVKVWIYSDFSKEPHIYVYIYIPVTILLPIFGVPATPVDDVEEYRLL